MTPPQTFLFTDENLQTGLDRRTGGGLHAPDFGVIGFNTQGVVTRYNTVESKAAGLSMERVLGKSLCTVVAPCMNNFMVAQRFDDATQASSVPDATIDYVLTLRMRPVKVKLRLLAAPGAATRYVLVQRHIS